MQCPKCHITGSTQLFLNNKNEIRYARVRHYKGLNEFKKPQFEYHKLEDLQQLETLLKSFNLQFPTVKAPSGHKIADQTGKTIDHGQTDSSSISKNMWAGSSARIEHHPPKTSRDIDPSLDPAEYREFLLSKFSRSYALQLFNNGIRHFSFLENPQGISAIPSSTRGNVLKAMMNLSKFLGCYQEYKLRLKNMVLNG